MITRKPLALGLLINAICFIQSHQLMHKDVQISELAGLVRVFKLFSVLYIPVGKKMNGRGTSGTKMP